MILKPAAGYKPLDFGQGGITGSINDKGRLISLNAYHPDLGYVTLSSAAPFPEDLRYQPSAVRSYRLGLAQQPGYGLAFDQAIIHREAWLQDDVYPCVRLRFGDGSEAESICYALAGLGFVQHWRFSDPQISLRYSGRVWLQRCAYTQLTEGGPAPMPASAARIHHDEAAQRSLFENAALPYAACLRGLVGRPQPDGSIVLDSEAFSPDSESFSFVIGLGLDTEAAASALHLLEESSHAPELPAAWHSLPPDPILRRGISYGLACCVPVEPEGLCILTDHMILPLSWNRDAYYVALALLNWDAAQADTVRRHLVWIFEQAERIDGLWGRSYLANGRVKDRGFQLDQQLFPILEWLDYLAATQDKATQARFLPQVEALLHDLERVRHPSNQLYATEETPADDPIALPYHLSSHILLWRVLSRMQAQGLGDHYGEKAEAIRSAIAQHFVTRGATGVSLYAYASDGAGHYHLYHDANDFPLALAPAWAYCDASDPIWRATMDFAFSPANLGAYYDGHLGSVHTQAPWALGDIQDLIVAQATQDSARSLQADVHLAKAAQWDGALPEAYDADSGAVVSRYWFAWPNAAYTCLKSGAFEA